MLIQKTIFLFKRRSFSETFVKKSKNMYFKHDMLFFQKNVLFWEKKMAENYMFLWSKKQTAFIEKL